MWLFGEDRRSAVEAMGAVLWAWLSRCMECTAVLCPKLLRDGVAAKAERIQLLAILTGKERAAVQGSHLSEDALGVRVVEANPSVAGCLRGCKCEDARDGAKGLDRCSRHVCTTEPRALSTASKHCTFVLFVEQYWQQIQGETGWDCRELMKQNQNSMCKCCAVVLRQNYVGLLGVYGRNM